MPRRNKKRKDRAKDKRTANENSRRGYWPLSLSAPAIVILAIYAYVYHYHLYPYMGDIEGIRRYQTLESLLNAEKSVSVNPRTRVAVGFGACRDMIVQSKDVFSDSSPVIPEHFSSITTDKELLQVFAYFYRHGAAAERFIENYTLFTELVNIAMISSRSKYVIGGNAPVMANRFAKEGCDVLLGAQMSENLQELLHKNIKISGPTVKKDDIHLLLEYPAGQVWGNLVSPRANRFIIHSDELNPYISSLELFANRLEYFDANLLVIGGLQMMDNFPMNFDVRKRRLQEVKEMLVKQPKTTRIHFEMASFSDEQLLKELIEAVIPFADSLGMNEQELPNLYHVMMYGNVSLVADPYPRVSTVLDQMRDVFRITQLTTDEHKKRQLTRLHVHTLAFQAIMIDINSSWKNTLAATAKAALTANRHTCGSDEINLMNAKLIMDDSFSTSQKGNFRRIPFETERPVACWNEANLQICVAPVLVCTKVLQTGGGGDNISSAGLVLQI